MSDTKISEAAPVAYMTNESNTGSAKIMARVVIVGDFGGDERAMHEMARAFGWKPLYLHQQPAELAEQQELDFYREHIGNDLDNLLIGTGVMQVVHEGGYEACWANTMEAVERLAARQPGAQEELHGFLKNSTPLREAALRALGFIDRSDEHGRTAYDFLRRELHAECAVLPAQQESKDE